ncbi:MAG: thiosulfate oxidation carrier complex protein SoxZ [Alphaproteobacteria bacterium]|jgi:thiosulfate oxidation carrier complex protein SoxZ|nr:thiosulfate oxidation carrier complex protein SoxZ [Alphaproteobacteria bacterium]
MTTLNAPRVRIPRQVRAGEVFEVRTLIEHAMETGLRQEAGRTIPRDILTRMAVRVNGEVALDAALHNGTAANPFHVFFLKLDRSSDIEFIWTDERGREARHSARVIVA